MKPDNDLRYTAKATQKWFKDNKVNVLKRQRQTSDLSPIQENLWLIACPTMIPPT